MVVRSVAEERETGDGLRRILANALEAQRARRVVTVGGRHGRECDVQSRRSGRWGV